MRIRVSVVAVVCVVGWGLACSGPTPEQVAAEEAQRVADEAARGAELLKNGPAQAIDQQLAGICKGETVNVSLGLMGHQDAVSALAIPKVLWSSWIDPELAKDEGVQELAPTDVAWYYALDAYCASATVCAGTACTLDTPEMVLQLEHRLVDGEPRIVAAFKGVTLGSDTAGIQAARGRWLAVVEQKHPSGAAPAPAPAPAGEEVAANPEPEPAKGPGGGGRGGGGGGGGGGGKAGKRPR